MADAKTLNINVKNDIQSDAASELTRETKKQAEAVKQSTKLFTNLTAGGSKTVSVVKALNGLLHGSTRGMLAFSGMLGKLAGPASVIGLAIAALMKFRKEAEETARKLRQAFTRIEDVAQLYKLDKISDSRNVTYEQARKAEADFNENNENFWRTRDQIIALNDKILKARVEGKGYIVDDDGGKRKLTQVESDFNKLQNDMDRYGKLMDANEAILKQYGSQVVEQLKSSREFNEAVEILTKGVKPKSVESYKDYQSAAPVWLQDRLREEGKQEKTYETVLAGKVGGPAQFMSSLDKIGGYTSNLVNSQFSPELQEMKTQTIKLSQIVENTKKTSARFSS